MTVCEWFEMWLRDYVMPSALADNSKRNYAQAVRRMVPALGGLQMRGLCAADLQRYLVGAAAVHPRAAQLDRSALSKSIKLARKLGLTECMIDEDTLPKPQHKPRKAAVFTADQARAYTREAAQLGAVGFVLLCCCFGLRRSEALGLLWSDLDMEKHTVNVHHQRARPSGAFALAPLKSDHSYRCIALPAWVFDALPRAPGKIAYGPILPSSAHTLYKAHYGIIERLQLPRVTPHGLRHTFAVLALKSGAGLKDLQMLLGHSKISITADLYADHPENVIIAPFLFA